MDAHLGWRSGKASLRKAALKTSKTMAVLVKGKGKRQERRSALQREGTVFAKALRQKG